MGSGDRRLPAVECDMTATPATQWDVGRDRLKAVGRRESPTPQLARSGRHLQRAQNGCFCRINDVHQDDERASPRAPATPTAIILRWRAGPAITLTAVSNPPRSALMSWIPIPPRAVTKP